MPRTISRPGTDMPGTSSAITWLTSTTRTNVTGSVHHSGTGCLGRREHNSPWDTLRVASLPPANSPNTEFMKTVQLPKERTIVKNDPLPADIEIKSHACNFADLRQLIEPLDPRGGTVRDAGCVEVDDVREAGGGMGHHLVNNSTRHRMGMSLKGDKSSRSESSETMQSEIPAEGPSVQPFRRLGHK